MKKIIALLYILTFVFLLFGCSANEMHGEILVTDDLGNRYEIPYNASIAACYGSLADAWQLSGGIFSAVTSDCESEHGLSFDNEPKIIGTVKSIDIEKICASGCDYVLLSADLTAHLKLKERFIELGIPFGYFRLDTFSDYSRIMELFCKINKSPDLFKQNVTDISNRINSLFEELGTLEGETRTVLLIRAYSSGIKAKSDDNLAGIILRELGIKNIADDYPSILENLSYEYIVERNPDYILVLTMGDEEAAKLFFEENFLKNSALISLSAIKNEKYYILPKELFHHKPNERFYESYEYIAKIFYPEKFK